MKTKMLHNMKLKNSLMEYSLNSFQKLWCNLLGFCDRPTQSSGCEWGGRKKIRFTTGKPSAIEPKQHWLWVLLSVAIGFLCNSARFKSHLSDLRTFFHIFSVSIAWQPILLTFLGAFASWTVPKLWIFFQPSLICPKVGILFHNLTSLNICNLTCLLGTLIFKMLFVHYCSPTNL